MSLPPGRLFFVAKNFCNFCNFSIDIYVNVCYYGIVR